MFAVGATNDIRQGFSVLACCTLICSCTCVVTGMYICNKGLDDQNFPIAFSGAALISLPLAIITCALSCHAIFQQHYPPSSEYSLLPTNDRDE